MFLFTNRAPSAPQTASVDAVPHAAPLKQASKATGVSFDYLAKTAERESRFNPAAKATTSSATGMFQFLEQTWLGMVKQEGPKMGLQNEAAAISSDGGRFSVTDGAMRQKILKLREDPGVSAMMAGAFAARNGQQLEQALGRKPKEGELYIAHFLGASGARDLINLAQASPDAKASSHFRDAASANRSVFFDKSGRARSASEVYANLTGNFSANPVLQPQETAATTDKAFAMFRVKGEGKPMHGLFRSNGEPVASAVTDAWKGMGRRAGETNGGDGQNGAVRVAFYPRDIKANGSAMQPLTATDASPVPLVPEGPRRAVTMPLPQARPASLQAGPPEANAAVPARKRSAGGKGAQPLDLMRFMRTGTQS
jgi:hypothetical protein